MVHAVKAPSDVGLARRIAMVAYTEYASDPRVRREAETLVAEGHRVEAIVLRPRSGPSAAELDGVHLHEVPLSARRGGGMRYLYQYAVFFLLSSLLLFRLYRRVRFNLIYIHSLPDFQVFCALPFKCMRIPVLLDLHEPMPEIVVARLRRPTGSAWFRISAAIERLSCLFADHVIVANDGIRDAVVSRRVSPSRVTTVYNVYEVGPRPVSPEEVRRRLGLPEGRLLVHAGGVSPERDLATLVEAVALLPGHDDIHLVIAGEGAPEYIEALRGLAHHLGLGDRIRFVPKMQLELARALVALSEIGIVTLESNPLTQIAWPTRLVELVALRKPLVVPQLPLLASVLRDAARYYPPGDPQGLARALQEVLTNKHEWESKAEEAARVCQEFDGKRARTTLLEILHRVDNPTIPSSAPAM